MTTPMTTSVATTHVVTRLPEMPAGGGDCVVVEAALECSVMCVSGEKLPGPATIRLDLY